MRLKKARYEITFVELCSPGGFVLNIELYKGKRDETQTGPTSKINNLIFRLLKPFIDKGSVLQKLQNVSKY